MRLYTFNNFYLSSIQQGIQTAHVVSELFADREMYDPQQRMVLEEWARNHKTIICLNGGNNQSLQELWIQVNELGNQLHLPHNLFHEDEQSLNGALTSVGIVVPAHIYEMQPSVQDTATPISPEARLCALLQTYRLAH